MTKTTPPPYTTRRRWNVYSHTGNTLKSFHDTPEGKAKAQQYAQLMAMSRFSSKLGPFTVALEEERVYTLSLKDLRP